MRTLNDNNALLVMDTSICHLFELDNISATQKTKPIRSEINGQYCFSRTKRLFLFGKRLDCQNVLFRLSYAHTDDHWMESFWRLKHKHADPAHIPTVQLRYYKVTVSCDSTNGAKWRRREPSTSQITRTLRERQIEQKNSTENNAMRSSRLLTDSVPTSTCSSYGAVYLN